MKKVLNTILSIIIAITIMVQPMSQVHSESSMSIEEYLTEFKLIVDNDELDGEWNPNIGDYIEGGNGHIQLMYKFEFPNVHEEEIDGYEFEIGKEYSFSLPEGFVPLLSEPTKQKFEMELDGKKYDVGEYWIETDGTVKFVIDFEGINDFDHRVLTHDFKVHLDQSKFEDGDSTEIHYDFGHESDYSIIINPKKHNFKENDGKSGHLYRDNSEIEETDRPTHAYYKVRINTQLKSYENAKVIDTFLTGQKLVNGSVKITKITYNHITGDVKETLDVTKDYNVEGTDDGFKILFGNIDTEYVVEYHTTIPLQDFGESEVKNKIKIILDGIENIYDTSFTAKWGIDNPRINKKFYKLEKDIITWEVYYNFNGEEVGNPIKLFDTLNEGYYVEDSLKVYTVDVTTDGEPKNEKEVLTGVEATKTEDGLNITIENQDKQALVLRYQTKVDANFEGIVKNEITDNEKTDDAEKEVNTKPTTTKKGTVEYKEGKPLIKWEVVVNSEKFNITNKINIFDEFDTEYIKLVTDPIKVKKDNTVMDENDGYVINNKEENGFNLTISEGGPHTYTITYYTEYTLKGQIADIKDIENKVTINTGGENGVITESPNTKPEPGITKNGEYVDHEISPQEDRIEWTVTFNENGLILNKPTITDIFEPANIELFKDTLKIYKENVSENALLEDTDYNFEDIKDDNDSTKTIGFKIIFKEITEAVKYIMKYETTVDQAHPEQKNTARIIDEDQLESTDSDIVSKRVLGISKEGEQEVLQDGTKVNHYTVKFNENKYAIDNLVLTDIYTPSGDDIKVTNLTLTYEDDGNPVDLNKYDVNYVENGKFTITFKETTERRTYVLKYTTNYPIEYQNKDIENIVEIEYNGHKEVADKKIPKPTLIVEKKANGVNNAQVPYKIEWEIQANTDRTKNYVYLKDATLTDKIESDQRFLPDTLKLYYGKRTDTNDLVIDEVRPVDLNDSNLSWDEDKKEFTITLPDGLNEFIVTYETEAIIYPSLNAKDGYYNKVTLTNETKREALKDSDSDDAYKKIFGGGDNNNSDKSGYQDIENDEIVWEIIVNKHRMPIKNGYMIDELDENQTYIKDPDKFKVEVAVILDGEEQYQELNKEDYILTFEPEENSNSFKLVFNERTDDPTEIEGGITQKYRITYRTELKEGFFGIHSVSNAFKIIGKGNDEIDKTEGGETSAEKWYSFAGGSGSSAQLTIEKSDISDNDKKLSLVKFDLYRAVGKLENPDLHLIKEAIITDSNGKAEIKNIRAGRYVLYETDGKFGYDELPKEGIKFILSYDKDKNPIVLLDDANWHSKQSEFASAEGAELFVYNKKDKTSAPSTEIEITKKWVDGDNADGLRPESITVGIYADGELYETHVLNSDNYLDNSWKFVITDLPEFKEDGSTPITYTIEELGLDSEVYISAKDLDNEYTLINTHEFEKTELSGQKVWEDDSNRDGIRPETLKISLYRHLESNEEKELVATKEISGSNTNTWNYEFKDLTKNKLGEPYIYTVVEENVEGYTQEGPIEGIFTNTHEPAKTSISVEKVWKDLDNAYELRPESITINLEKNGEIVDSIDLKDENNWKHTFSDLFVYEDGELITYTLNEKEVTYYDGDISLSEGSLNDYIVTNTINREKLPKVSLTVIKDWINGPKPNVVFHLLQNGEKIEEIELTKEMSWTHTFDELEKYDEEGKVYEYTVIEHTKLENYEVSDTVYEDNTATITNTYVSPLTSKSVKKIWVDGPVDKTPIEVQLYRNGAPHLEPITLDGTEKDAWTHTWDKLDLNDHNGVEYAYSVQEVTEVENFGVEYSEVDGVFVITNTFESPTTSVIGRKSWVNGPSVKPDVTLQLLRNGEKHLEPVVLKSGEYEYIWLDLDVLDNTGELYVYTVEEVDVPENYVASYDGMDVTNTYVIPVTDITVEKLWIHEKRETQTIGVQLYRNGEAFGDVVRLEKGTNTYTWKDLDLTDLSGNEYVYTVDEVEVPLGYHKEVHGFTIINTFDQGLLDALLPKPEEKPNDKLPVTGAVSLASIATGTLLASGLFFVLSKKRKED